MHSVHFSFRHQYELSNLCTDARFHPSSGRRDFGMLKEEIAHRLAATILQLVRIPADSRARALRLLSCYLCRISKCDRPPATDLLIAAVLVGRVDLARGSFQIATFTSCCRIAIAAIILANKMNHDHCLGFAIFWSPLTGHACQLLSQMESEFWRLIDYNAQIHLEDLLVLF